MSPFCGVKGCTNLGKHLQVLEVTKDRCIKFNTCSKHNKLRWRIEWLSMEEMKRRYPPMDRYTEEFVLPFGKHKGEDIGIVPRKYLTWIQEDVDMDDYEGLEDAIDEELAMRDRSHVTT